MAKSIDYKKEWFAKARVDYFPHFLSLWLACNSWYNIHYLPLNTDRAIVDKLKSDPNNNLYKKFDAIFSGSSTKEQKSLYSNLELLYYSLNRAVLQPGNLILPLSYTYVLIDFSKKKKTTGYITILVKDAATDTKELEGEEIEGVQLGDVVISNDVPVVFAGILEIIYQVRCMLVHGEIDPKVEENHEVVKYCYLILHDLMEDFCS
jgi:hypothetical protein